MTDQIQTTPEQALRGTRLASGGKTECTDCRRTIREGDAVGVYATRGSDDRRVEPRRVVCRNCRDETLPHRTPNATQLIVYGTLGVTSDAASREATLTLRDPEPMRTATTDTASE